MLTSFQFRQKSTCRRLRDLNLSNWSYPGYSNEVVSDHLLLDWVQSIFLMNFPAFFEPRPPPASLRASFCSLARARIDVEAFGGEILDLWCYYCCSTCFIELLLLVLEQLTCMVTGARRFWGVDCGIIIKSCSGDGFLKFCWDFATSDSL